MQGQIRTLQVTHNVPGVVARNCGRTFRRYLCRYEDDGLDGLILNSLNKSCLHSITLKSECEPRTSFSDLSLAKRGGLAPRTVLMRKNNP